VNGNITVDGTVGNGSGLLFVEADSASDVAVLTRLAAGTGQQHNLAIRSAAGAGGNQVLVDKDDLVAQSLTSNNASTLKKGVEIWGGYLALKDDTGGEDTDPMRISRFHRAADQNDMRIQIGDNLDGQDRLVVGPVYYSDSQFKENFIVDNLGNVTAAGTITAATLSAAAASVQGRDLGPIVQKVDGISAGAKNVGVLMGEVADGGQIPLPQGFSESNCRWLVTPKSVPPSLGGTVVCYTPPGSRTVTAQIQIFGINVSFSANYIIVGVQ
jgi:hypothetical protein